MPRIPKLIAIAVAVLALASFLSAIWIQEHSVKLIWTGIVFLFAAICVSAFNTPVKK